MISLRPPGTIERTRKFLLDKKIVTVPSEVRPTIVETPAFMRTGGFALMDTPGAYETKATEAFYYVTPPEKEWEPAERRNTCDSSTATAMDIITIHEAFPGHYRPVPQRQAVPDQGAEALLPAGRTSRAGRTTPSR